MPSSRAEDQPSPATRLGMLTPSSNSVLEPVITRMAAEAGLRRPVELAADETTKEARVEPFEVPEEVVETVRSRLVWKVNVTNQREACGSDSKRALKWSEKDWVILV